MMIVLVADFSLPAGYILFAEATPQVLAGLQGVAAEAILVMIIDTMAPEAFE